jgi:DNA-binding SARP family transcriptional activator
MHEVGCVLSVSLLGGFHVRVGPRLVHDSDWRLRKTKNLIKLLALAPGHRLHREQVMELLWPDQDPEAAANNLHKAIYMARRALESGLSPAAPSSYLHLHSSSLVLIGPDREVRNPRRYSVLHWEAR